MNKTEMILFRCNKATRQAVKASAAAQGVSVSEYLRTLAWKDSASKLAWREVPLTEGDAA